MRESARFCTLWIDDNALDLTWLAADFIALLGYGRLKGHAHRMVECPGEEEAEIKCVEDGVGAILG